MYRFIHAYTFYKYLYIYIFNSKNSIEGVLNAIRQSNIPWNRALEIKINFISVFDARFHVYLYIFMYLFI